MNTATAISTSSSSATPAATRQKAQIVREYGPFPVERVHGVTHDGTHVWFARGQKLAAMNPETGALEREISAVADAGTAFDGAHFYQIGQGQIQKLDPKTGDIVGTLPLPGNANDNSGLGWDAGTLWVGQFAARALHRIDATTGKLLKTLQSDRHVTGITCVDGQLWHGTWEDGVAELRRLDSATGRVLQTLEMPPGEGVSGLEGRGNLLFCGGIKRPIVRAVKRPAPVL